MSRQRGFSFTNLLKRNSTEVKTIHICSLNNDVEGVRTILKRDKNAVNAQDPITGQTALHVAVFEGHTGMAGLLLEMGSDANQRDHNGWTALHSCCKGNSTNFVEITRILIVDGKAQVDALTNSGGTPLHYYVQGDCNNTQLFEDTIQLMITHGADINSQSKYGETPLHQAASRGKLISVQILIKFGAQINFRNKDGETALHLAIKNGFKDLATFLIDNGANPSIESSTGCCRQYCHQFGQLSILAHLNTKFSIQDNNNIINNNNQRDENKKLEIDPELVEKVEKMGYDSAAIMIALFNLHKRGLPTSELSILLAELDVGCATNASECKVCLENSVNCVVLPCRHSSMCVQCAELCKGSSGECPICREKINEVIQIYLS